MWIFRSRLGGQPGTRLTKRSSFSSEGGGHLLTPPPEPKPNQTNVELHPGNLAKLIGAQQEAGLSGAQVSRSRRNTLGNQAGAHPSR